VTLGYDVGVCWLARQCRLASIGRSTFYRVPRSLMFARPCPAWKETAIHHQTARGARPPAAHPYAKLSFPCEVDGMGAALDRVLRLPPRCAKLERLKRRTDSSYHGIREDERRRSG